MKRAVISLGLLVGLFTRLPGILVSSSMSQDAPVGIYTYHGDNMRTGWNAHETVLTQEAVRSRQFGRLWTVKVDGNVYAQPLYAPAVDLGTTGIRNLLLVATENNSVYAFDADAGKTPLWKTALGTPVPSTVINCGNIYPQYGITGTPVIDPATFVLYVVANTWENNQQYYRLHALDIRSGQERPGWPVEIKGAAPGNGGGSLGGQIAFDPAIQLQRPGLLLLNGRVIIAFGSHCDNQWSRYHGWVFSYSAADPSQPPSIFNTTPDATTSDYDQGGIWQGGFGLAADGGGNIYFETGNGNFDADQGGRNLSDSFVRLSTPGGTLTFTPDPGNFYTPGDQIALEAHDGDLGSGGAMVIPDQPDTTTPRLLVGSGKDGVVRLLNRDFLGGFLDATDPLKADGAVQSVPTAANLLQGTGEIYGGPAYYEGPAGQYVFYVADETVVRFRLGKNPNGSGTSRLIADQKGTDLGTDWATPVVSSNGRSSGTGVVWVLRQGDDTLRAYSAEDLSLLWNSNEHGQLGFDALAAHVMRFAVPTVVNGKVYADTQNSVVCYGLR